MFLWPSKIQTTQAIFTCQCQDNICLEPVHAALFASYSLMVDFNHNGATAVLSTVISGGNGLERTTAPLGELKL